MASPTAPCCLKCVYFSCEIYPDETNVLEGDSKDPIPMITAFKRLNKEITSCTGLSFIRPSITATSLKIAGAKNCTALPLNFFAKLWAISLEW